MHCAAVSASMIFQKSGVNLSEKGIVKRSELHKKKLAYTLDHLTAEISLVSRGHTPFCKRGKGSGNFRYSSLLPRTVECGPITAHYSVT